MYAGNIASYICSLEVPMSLPSIPAIAIEKNLTLTELSTDQCEEILTEAMRRDLPLAVELLHQKSHEVGEDAGQWLADPNSDIGKQLTRLHASDALRPLASKHFCHGKHLTFVNCCKGKVGEPPSNILELQIRAQAGPIAYADC